MKQLKKKTALIVDDAEINRVILTELLQDDLNLIEAESIDGAIDIIQSGKTPIDIILLDLIFPEKSGFDLLEFLRGNHYLDEIPVIVMSSEGSDDFIERAFLLGAIDYVRKPFTERILVRRVLTTLLLYQNKKELIRKIEERYETPSSR
ncbi:MAG: response regulator [Lachnospiraceae bacterium]|nr:response regulator [Lachnospiraceae bacterium]